jgi:FkbM family methyltransferase
VRIFVDVGAHYGETLDVALDPAWGFDRVFVLEPASACWPVLDKFRDRRLDVQPIGLGAATATVPLYGAGLLGASLFPTKRQKVSADEIVTEQIQLVRASEWFAANIPARAEVYIKFNCEGAECDIIDELLSAGLGKRLTSLYIDFDIRKVEGLAHRQKEVEGRLEGERIPFETSDTLGCVANPAVEQWLAKHCPRVPARWTDALRYRFGTYAPAYVRMTLLAAKILPPRLYFWLGRRFGRMARAS